MSEFLGILAKDGQFQWGIQQMLVHSQTWKWESGKYKLFMMTQCDVSTHWVYIYVSMFFVLVCQLIFMSLVWCFPAYLYIFTLPSNCGWTVVCEIH